MQFFKTFFLTGLFALMLIGCQGNNSDAPVSSSGSDNNGTLPPININSTKDPVSLQFVYKNDINVSSSGQKIEIYIRAFDVSGTLNTKGSITVQYPSKPDAGQFSPNTAKIVDGIARFTYTAPIDLQGRVNAGDKASNYRFFSTTNSNVTATLHVNYTPSSSISIGNPVLQTLVLSESTINITQSNETKNLTLFAYTDQSTTDVNLSIGVKYGDTSTDVGYFSPVSPSVVDGRATFAYYGPSNLLNTSGSLATTKFTLYDKQNPGITAPLTVNFVPNLPIIRVENPTVSLTSDSQSETVTVLAFDSVTKKAFNTGTILVEYPTAITDGSVSGGTFTQNEAAIKNGKATFTFKGPNPLTAIANQLFTFKYKENPTVSTALTIQYTPNLPKIASLAINEQTTVLTQNSQKHTIIINAIDANGNFVNSGTINVKFPAAISNGTDVGTFTLFSVPVVNGQATFSYTGPTDLVATSGITTNETFIFSDAANNANTVNWTTKFTPDTPTLRVEAPTVILTTNGQAETVTVLAFDSNNQAFNTGTILVEYPTAITDGSVSGGTFTQNEAAIKNGKATFTFKGPNPLTAIANQLFTFKYKENPTVSTVLTIKYIPEVPRIIIKDGNVTVTRNGEVVTVKLSVFNTDNTSYNGGGNINIKYPDSVLSGKNIGSFDKSSVAVVNGKAEFIYTAPDPLDGNDSIIFTFYHDSQPILSEKDFNVTIVPDANQTVLTNYSLHTIYNTSMPLKTTKGMIFNVEDDKGNKISDSNVTSITATVLNSALGSLEDTNGNTGNSLIINGKNNVQMNIKTKTLSGLIPIRVDAKFKDVNNKDNNLTKVINIVVLSGAPTAMSLSYAGTSQDSVYAKFIENWVLTVTDKYNNLVNTTPTVSMGAIIGYAKSSAVTANVADYLYYNATANDGNLTDANPDTFTSTKAAFGNVDLVNDKLVLFGGDGYKFNAFGKWDIDTISADNKSLTLKDDYNGTTVSGLAYAVGHNFRNETCSGTPVVANVYAKDGNNTLGSIGSMIVQVEYNYYFVGKSIVLWTNLVGESNNTLVKIGLGRKVTLRGSGLTGDSYNFVKGGTGIHRLYVKINKTVEYYKNANFGYTVEISGDGNNYNVIGTSMDQNITSCKDGNGKDSGGVAYVDINITDANNSGVVKLVNVLPSKEF